MSIFVEAQTRDFGGGVQTITTTTTRVLVAEALGNTDFPTMLYGVLRGRRKGDPNTSVVGKKHAFRTKNVPHLSSSLSWG